MKIDNLKLSPLAKEDELLSLAIRKSKIKPSQIKTFKVLKKSLDARDKNDIKYVYSVEISDREEKGEKLNLPTINSLRHESSLS